jgi:hypothetical protein
VKNPDDYDISYVFKEGKLKGILVLKKTVRKDVRCGEIMDIICSLSDDACFQAMLLYACDYLRADGCTVVQAWVPEGSRAEGIYKKCHFLLKRKYVPVLINDDAHLLLKSGWDLTQGDGNDT